MKTSLLARGLAVALLLASGLTHAMTAQELQELVTKICAAPKQAGSEYEVTGSGDAQVISFKGGKIAGPSLGAGIKFTRKEWEGIRRVLDADVVKDNDQYRNCVRDLTPKFLEKVSIRENPNEGLLDPPTLRMGMDEQTFLSGMAGRIGTPISREGQRIYRLRLTLLGIEGEGEYAFQNDQLSWARVRGNGMRQRTNYFGGSAVGNNTWRERALKHEGEIDCLTILELPTTLQSSYGSPTARRSFDFRSDRPSNEYLCDDLESMFRHGNCQSLSYVRDWDTYTFLAKDRQTSINVDQRIMRYWAEGRLGADIRGRVDKNRCWVAVTVASPSARPSEYIRFTGKLSLHTE